MKVQILVEFDVPDAEDEDVAKSAAAMAAYEHLNLSDCEPYECSVHVRGHGEYVVRMG